MKKILAAILAASLTLSLAACSSKEKPKTAENTNKPNTESSSGKKDDIFKFVPKKVTVFTDILDNLGNKDNYYLDTTGTTLKILDKDAFKAYTEKASAITKKAMEDQKVDMANTKVYTYHKNANGDKAEKDYVVVFDANKVPTDLYEVSMTVDDKGEPTFKEAKKVENAVDDNFKKLFADEVKEAE